MVSTSALHAEGPGFTSQVEPRAIPPAHRKRMGGDTSPSEIQFLRGDGNIRRSGVEVRGGGSKKAEKKAYSDT